MNTPLDSEVIQIMVDGGEKLCDYAIEQWASGKYRLSYEATQENLARWHTIRRRIRGLAKEMRQLIDSAD